MKASIRECVWEVLEFFCHSICVISMVMIADLLWATCVSRHYFFTQENKNIYFTTVDS